jgi:hypothetical protein
MAAQLFTLPKQIAISSSFAALPGAKLYFYLSGTSSPQDTYQDADLDAEHENPVPADISGTFPVIYLDPSISYKCELKTSADVLLYTADPCNSAFPSAGQVNIASSVGGTANAITAALVPDIDVYTPLMAVVFTPEDDSTSTVTFNLSGVGALPVQYVGGDALTGAELQEDHPALLILNAAGTAWELQNPYVLKSRGLEVGPRYLTTTQVTGATYTTLPTDKIISLDRAGNQTLTIDTTLPEGSTWEILGNVSGTKTITVSAGTFFWFNGSGTVGSGNRTLAIAGTCTVTIYPTGNAIVRGSGLT